MRHAFVSPDGTLLDLGQLLESLGPAGSAIVSVGVGINRGGQLIGRYTIGTPSDAQIPTKTRSLRERTHQADGLEAVIGCSA